MDFELRETAQSMPITTLADGSRGVAWLSIVCITEGMEKVLPLLMKMQKTAAVLGAEFLLCVDIKDGLAAYERIQHVSPLIMAVKSEGYLESVLNVALEAARGAWILRLDDDEEMSYALFRWLVARKYLLAERWLIPTAALWGDTGHFITSSPLWPDIHLRLTTWDFPRWNTELHAASPKMGRLAPVCILHHKYLLNSYEERRRKAQQYDSIKEDGGTGKHLPFTLPEDAYNEVTILPVEKGYFAEPMKFVGFGKTLTLKRR